MSMQRPRPVPIRELVAALKDPRYIVLIGLPGCGKSTVAAGLVDAGYVHINADSVRAELYGDEAVQGKSEAVFGLVYARLDAALAAGEKIVIDLTNLTRKGRRDFVDKARQAGRRPVFLFLDVPLSECARRNAVRGRQVPAEVLQNMAAALRRNGLPDAQEGDLVCVRPELDGSVTVVPANEKLLAFGPNEGGTADDITVTDALHDVVGDVHGCEEELLQLLAQLGYGISIMENATSPPMIMDVVAPPGRKLVFAGDLVDRGPASGRVLALVMQLVERGIAVAIHGNHDHKLMRLLRGNPVKPDEHLAETLRQIDAFGPQFREQVLRFLEALPYKYETQSLIVVHAAYAESGNPQRLQALMLYGEVDGTKDEHGYPRRLDLWERRYYGDKVIVHGHIPVPEVTVRDTTNGGKVINVDTGAPFGGKLTAVRLPQLEYVQVQSARTYLQHPGFD